MNIESQIHSSATPQTVRRMRVGLRMFMLLCLMASLLFAWIGLRTTTPDSVRTISGGVTWYDSSGRVSHVDLSDETHYDESIRLLVDDDLRQIAAMRHLESVGVRGNDVTNDGIAHLSQLSNLKHLKLRTPRVNGLGLAHLRTLTNLQSLDIHETQMNGIELLQLRELKNLRVLVIPRDVNAETLTRLQEALPECEIRN